MLGIRDSLLNNENMYGNPRYNPEGEGMSRIGNSQS